MWVHWYEVELLNSITYYINQWNLSAKIKTISGTMKIKLNTLEGFKKERKMVFWSPVELDVGKSTLKGWGINFFFLKHSTHILMHLCSWYNMRNDKLMLNIVCGLLKIVFVIRFCPLSFIIQLLIDYLEFCRVGGSRGGRKHYIGKSVQSQVQLELNIVLKLGR